MRSHQHQQFESDDDDLRSAINDSPYGIGLEDDSAIHHYVDDNQPLPPPHRQLVRYVGERANLVSLYDPDTNGWCGYACLAFALGFAPVSADRLASAIRWRLLNNLRDHRQQWVTFFGDEEFNRIWQQITMIPDESSDWWFSSNLMWVCVHTFERSFLFLDTLQNVPCLYQHPADRLDPDVLIVLNVHNEHVLALKIRSLSHLNVVPDIQADYFQTTFFPASLL